jgi:hypothetical protein
MNMLSLLVIALLGESIWETLKMVWQTGKLSADKVGALIVGIALTVGTGLDLFALVGVPIHIPYLGMILTGILISRGANFIHDLLASVNNLQQNTKATVIANFSEDTEKESGIDYKDSEVGQQNEVKQEQVNQTAENSNPGTNTQSASAGTTPAAQ